MPTFCPANTQIGVALSRRGRATVVVANVLPLPMDVVQG
jgi:hypothetical protein